MFLIFLCNDHNKYQREFRKEPAPPGPSRPEQPRVFLEQNDLQGPAGGTIFFMLAFVVSRLQETRRGDTGESLERLSLLGASWSVGRSTRGAARNGQRQERRPARPNQCKSSSLCVSITTSEVGLAVPASEKWRSSEASRPVWPSGTPGQPSRVQGRLSPEEAGRAGATAALSQRRRC